MEKYDQSLRSLKELAILKGKRKKSVEWRLSRRVKEEVEKKYIVEDFLYEIRTRSFNNIRTKEKILKELHYANKNKRRTICRQLSDDEKSILEKNNIFFRPVKYRIFFR
ncbi:MAG: hypothetical protein J6M60_00695 [Clostridia bacterium]|nr:hypothetical protein [Clostridia bacterium]